MSELLFDTNSKLFYTNKKKKAKQHRSACTRLEHWLNITASEKNEKKKAQDNRGWK